MKYVERGRVVNAELTKIHTTLAPLLHAHACRLIVVPARRSGQEQHAVCVQHSTGLDKGLVTEMQMLLHLRHRADVGRHKARAMACSQHSDESRYKKQHRDTYHKQTKRAGK